MKKGIWKKEKVITPNRIWLTFGDDGRILWTDIKKKPDLGILNCTQEYISTSYLKELLSLKEAR